MNRFKLLGVGILGLVLLGAGCGTSSKGAVSVIDQDPNATTTAGGYYEEVQTVKGVHTTVRPTDIHTSGQTADTFPILDHADFVTVEEAEAETDYFDELFGYAVETNDGPRFYSSQVLAWHNIVHDTINGQDALITFSPLTGTGGVFARAGGENFAFSGLVWNNDALFMDTETKSLWSALLGESIYGKRAGESLVRIPFEVMTWSQWKTAHPDGKVMSANTGYERRYNLSPYGSYLQTRSIYFALSSPYQPALEPKAVINGVTIDGFSKAYQEGPIVQAADRVLNDFIGEHAVVAWADAQNVIHVHERTEETVFVKIKGVELVDSEDRVWSLTENGDLVNGDQTFASLAPTSTFWFAWSATHPDTDLYAYVIGKGLVNGPYELHEGEGVNLDDGTTKIEVGDTSKLAPVIEGVSN
ncbi:hypothetical protein COV06_00695 [Candidatus Uhrbacteria bacterium CG10_big_fil_rev_8_21_14_0_10_50_16]|uniref:DUF3179 domain-containing protein n=1 Tax=Candidatus Uhrbacteria bacterium CG10_big_fil_rev_8_21_14_0_10_50_16 TaxID=1975039 RepID=A0A2H0RQ75_9BACT|nr:MAG: hypothetical protein COV06_00695 [Candidatus Uhrbacteria bacterium CG10_big_fil_rev_8_21_14_0_10_50_16]